MVFYQNKAVQLKKKSRDIQYVSFNKALSYFMNYIKMFSGIMIKYYFEG